MITCTHPSSLHINAPKKQTISNYIYSSLGGHIAASSTYGRFNGISRTLSFTQHSCYRYYYCY